MRKYTPLYTAKVLKRELQKWSNNGENRILCKGSERNFCDGNRSNAHACVCVGVCEFVRVTEVSRSRRRVLSVDKRRYFGLVNVSVWELSKKSDMVSLQSHEGYQQDLTQRPRQDTWNKLFAANRVSFRHWRMGQVLELNTKNNLTFMLQVSQYYHTLCYHPADNNAYNRCLKHTSQPTQDPLALRYRRIISTIVDISALNQFSRVPMFKQHTMTQAYGEWT